MASISMAKPEPQRDAAQAPIMMFDFNEVSKMSQTMTVSYFSFPFSFIPI
jgi:hypothetical protein